MVQSNFFSLETNPGCSLEKKAVSPLRTARDILLGGASVPQQQKFHTDDLNQCLHN